MVAGWLAGGRDARMVKKFIDKKTALRFKLVQRSVHDSSDREFVPMNARSERMLVRSPLGVLSAV